MADASIGWGGLAASTLLVVAAVALSAWRGLDLEAPMAWACARALAQLLVVGYALGALVDDDAPPAAAWVWVVAMVAFAGVTVARRAPEVPGAMQLALVAAGVTTALALAVVFGAGIYPAEARTIIPVAGMMVGNSISATVVAARRVVAELAEHRDDVEARLALGQPWSLAARSHVREASRTALTAQIESTKAVGLVFLPGAMTGLILAGVDPVDAVLVQAAVMFLILGCVAGNVTVVGVGLTRRLFTADHRLVPLARRVR